MESRWPDPTPEPDEQPRWWGRAALAVVIGAVALVAARSDDWPSWRWPNFTFPEINLPDFSLPENRSIDQTGTPPAAAPADENAASLGEQPPAADAERTTQPMPFETCLRMIGETANALNQQPIFIEDTADRRVARFKFVAGDLAMTCSRPDSTMTMERR